VSTICLCSLLYMKSAKNEFNLEIMGLGALSVDASVFGK
jgi:hypothetical protein